MGFWHFPGSSTPGSSANPQQIGTTPACFKNAAIPPPHCAAGRQAWLVSSHYDENALRNFQESTSESHRGLHSRYPGAARNELRRWFGQSGSRGKRPGKCHNHRTTLEAWQLLLLTSRARAIQSSRAKFICSNRRRKVPQSHRSDKLRCIACTRRNDLRPGPRRIRARGSIATYR